jgi:hypothetical protein
LILIQSCGGISSIYNFNYPLTSEIAKAKSSPLTVKIPNGWSAIEDNECKCTDLWLVKDDYSATLNFVALNLDSLTSNDIRNDEINSLVRISKANIKAKYGNEVKEFTKDEKFEINKNKFAAYEYLDEKMRNIRVVILRSGKQFYEFSAIPIKTRNLNDLFNTQNSVLVSINH